MPESGYRLVLTLAPALREALEAHAAAADTDIEEAAVALLSEAILAKPGPAPALERIRAEAAVVAHAETLASGHAAAGDWGPDVTHRVFEGLRDGALDDYATAVGGPPFATGNPEKARINRRIGRRVRAVLGAEVERDSGGAPRLATPPAGGPWLIRTYTPLLPGRP